MALSMEHGLADQIDRATPVLRPHGRKTATSFRLMGLKTPFASGRVEAAPKPGCNWADHMNPASLAPLGKPLSPAKLYQLIDLLGAIVADPEPRARRLAFHLARRRQGLLLPPAGPARIAGR